MSRRVIDTRDGRDPERDRERRERARRDRERARRDQAAATPARRQPMGASVTREKRAGLIADVARGARNLLFAAYALVTRPAARPPRERSRHNPPVRRPRPTQDLSPARRRALERRRELRRARIRLVTVVSCIAALVMGWLIVPRMDVFRIRAVAVEGASQVSDLAVRLQIQQLIQRQTVFTVDDAAIVQRLERMPFVRSARVERHLLGSAMGITVVIDEYRPLAIATNGTSTWLIARDGRVLAPARLNDWRGQVPVVQLEHTKIREGQRLSNEAGLHLLRAMPDDFPGSITAVTMQNHQLTAVLDDGVALRFGRSDDLLIKIKAAEAMLAVVHGRHGYKVDYIDVSVPSRPAPHEIS